MADADGRALFYPRGLRGSYVPTYVAEHVDLLVRTSYVVRSNDSGRALDIVDITHLQINKECPLARDKQVGRPRTVEHTVIPK